MDIDAAFPPRLDILSDAEKLELQALLLQDAKHHAITEEHRLGLARAVSRKQRRKRLATASKRRNR